VYMEIAVGGAYHFACRCCYDFPSEGVGNFSMPVAVETRGMLIPQTSLRGGSSSSCTTRQPQKYAPSPLFSALRPSGHLAYSHPVHDTIDPIAPHSWLLPRGHLRLNPSSALCPFPTSRPSQPPQHPGPNVNAPQLTHTDSRQLPRPLHRLQARQYPPPTQDHVRRLAHSSRNSRIYGAGRGF
jgi:hypothetical protein